MVSNVIWFWYVSAYLSGFWVTGYDINPTISADIRADMADIDVRYGQYLQLKPLTGTNTLFKILNHDVKFFSVYIIIK